MKKHIRKMIAPIVIAMFFVLYFIGIVVLFLSVPYISILGKIAMVLIPLAFCALMIGVTISRIKEIRKGEEDDLSKY